ncbi:MAG: trigger factor, partial [Rhodospirillales bacterium]|nr:trigger factor [Rhodospirillales bacterium]
IDFIGRVDGEEFAGGKADGYSLDIGSGSFVPGFEDQVIGHSVGETFDVTVTFPENYAEELASKEAVFEVTVTELKEGVPIEISDEIAKKMGLENLDALKKSIRDSHDQELSVFSRMRTKRDLLDILDKEHQFELPEGMLDAEFNAIWEQFQNQKENNPDQIDEDDKNKSEDELKAQYREIAERRVRLGLLLAEIGRMNEITVSPEELNRALMQEAQRHQGQEKEVLDYYKNNPEAMQALQSPVLEDKVVDFIVELGVVTEKEVTIEELMQNPDDDNASTANQDKPKKKKAAKKKAAAKSKANKKKD